MVAASGQRTVDTDQVLHPAHLARQDDAIAAQPDLLGPGRALQRRCDHHFAHHLIGVQRLRHARVFIHHLRDQALVQRAPVHADAHGLVVGDGGLDHARELGIPFLTAADIAGIDAVLGERLRALGVLGQQAVSVEMEIADQGYRHTARVQPLADRRHRARRLLAVDGDTHQLRAGTCQIGDLVDGSRGVGGICVGHRLHDHGRVSADHDLADTHTHSPVTLDRGTAHGYRGTRCWGIRRRS